MNRAEISTVPQTVADRSVAQPIPLQQRTWLQMLRTYGTPLIPLALVLIATAILLFGVLRSPPGWSLDVGASNDAHFVAGFLPPQHEGTLTYRWSSAQAQVLLPRTSVGLLRLRLHSDEYAITTRQRLRLERNDTELATLHLGLGWRVYQLLLPPGPTPAPGVGVVPLDLVSLRDGAEADDPDAPGMPVDRVQVAPLTGVAAAIQLPFQRTLIMIWGVGVAGGHTLAYCACFLAAVESMYHVRAGQRVAGGRCRWPDTLGAARTLSSGLGLARTPVGTATSNTAAGRVVGAADSVGALESWNTGTFQRFNVSTADSGW